MIYYFIENLTELNPKDEIKFSDNLVLKSIPNELLSELKYLIKHYHPHGRGDIFKTKKNDFEKTFHEYEKIKDISPVGISLRLRPKNDFRYFVLQENNPEKYNLIYPQAFSLSDKDFFMPFSFSYQENSVIKTSFSDLCIYSYYNDVNAIWDSKGNIHKRKSPNTFTEFDKLQILEYIELLNNFEKIKPIYPSIEKALKDFFLTYEISDYSVFKVVAYIACLESLLVDNSFDKLRSINSQLQTKLN